MLIEFIQTFLILLLIISFILIPLYFIVKYKLFKKFLLYYILFLFILLCLLYFKLYYYNYTGGKIEIYRKLPRECLQSSGFDRFSIYPGNYQYYFNPKTKICSSEYSNYNYVFKSWIDCMKTCAGISYKRLGENYIKSSGKIYYNSIYKLLKIENVEIESFKVLSYGYAKDDNSIYYKGERLDYIKDVSSFDLLKIDVIQSDIESILPMDKYNFYLGGNIIPKKEGKVKNLGYGLIIINGKIYFKNELLEGINGEKFYFLKKSINGYDVLATDNNSLIYIDGNYLLINNDINFDSLIIEDTKLVYDNNLFYYKLLKIPKQDYIFLRDYIINLYKGGSNKILYMKSGYDKLFRDLSKKF